MMMRVLYGTTNQAKYELMKAWLAELDIELLNLNDFNIDNLSVEESGKTALENARLKSLTYYEHLKIPVFSCDSSLYFEGVEAGSGN